MEDCLSSLKTASSQEYFDSVLEQHDFLSNIHHWYTTSHARPTYCNVCREALSGVKSHGLSCEVCKCKVHKRCAEKAIANCKWTTLATVGRDIIEDKDGSIIMPHQWAEGNLPVASTCAVCKKICGSVLRLQDWRCLWCKATVHTACRPNMPVICLLGPAKLSIVPPTCVHSIGIEEAWDVIKPQKNFSPLLVFVNSKSGDNQGLKFLRRFKQLLNPAQVFDLISTGPSLGLRLFRHFDLFRILVCSGDGSVGWVLSEIDRFDMHKQCRIAVLPLGTGNDLARVLGWGSSCDDDAHLPQILERYETASTKMLDRWSIMVFEKAIAIKNPRMSLSNAQEALLAGFVESANCQLQTIVEADDIQAVLSSARVLCETVGKLLIEICEFRKNDDQLHSKCDVLKQKINMLLEALRTEQSEEQNQADDISAQFTEASEQKSNPTNISSSMRNLSNADVVMNKSEKNKLNATERSINRLLKSSEREVFRSRANSIKKAIYNVVEHSEPGRPKRYQRRFSISPFESIKSTTMTSTDNMSPCTSPIPIPPINVISPAVSTTKLTCIPPFPDTKRDSTDENMLNMINLPAPKQFADGGSRRSSGIPEPIKETEESDVYLNDIYRRDMDNESPQKRMDFLKIPFMTGEQPFDPLSEFRPMEVFERNLYGLIMNKPTEKIESKSDFDTNEQDAMITIPNQSKNITTADTDSINKQSLSEDSENGSDILSNISNEECSLMSEIFDKPANDSSVQPVEDVIHVADIIQDLESDQLIHIDSPETSSTTEAMHGESLVDDISSVLCHDMIGALQDSTITDDTTTIYSDNVNLQQKNLRRQSYKKSNENKNLDDNLHQYGFENMVFEIDNQYDDKKVIEITRHCSLAQFIEGNDIARKSFKKLKSKSASTVATTVSSFSKIERNIPEIIESMIDDDDNNSSQNQTTLAINKTEINNLTKYPGAGRLIKSNLHQTTDKNNVTLNPPSSHQDVKRISFDESCKKESLGDEKIIPRVSVVVEQSSPLKGDKDNQRQHKLNEIRRHSSHSPSLTVREYDKEKDRRYSGTTTNQNFLDLDSEHMKFLSNSPAATRRISCGSLFKPNESFSLGGSKASLFMGSTLFGFENYDTQEKEDKSKSDKKEPKHKKLPIINPLVRLPAWPNVSSGFISKCLLANADTLCAAVSPLMDPDETLLEGYHEKCVMNNYFGIGIDAKISLDFHNKREEHPEKCRSRAKNYMWYGVLGSKQWLQKTYKNLEQRVQLECDGQRIPLPSLQGIVVLNIPSFMGGTNFWGGTKEDDIFLAPSFDDRILEVVAVFGSVQMAASRLINLQHHRIAQCQSVQINILGDEEVPIQVDGEAWLQPPGMIRIIHKNRVQMLCRNRNLEISLKAWQEKQRQHSVSIQREPTPFASECSTTDDMFSEREMYFLFDLIECTSSLVKWVKFLIISNPTIEHDLYALAGCTSDTLESIHPNGKLLESSKLRIKLVEVINSAKKLYEESCILLRERESVLVLKEDLETKLSTALANMEMILRKCIIEKCDDNQMKAFFNVLSPSDEPDTRKKLKPFWLRFRASSSTTNQTTTNIRNTVNNWGVNEVITWLETMQLSEYTDSFIKNDIRGKELLMLERRDLKDLGIIKVGHLKRIQQAIKDLSGN